MTSDEKLCEALKAIADDFLNENTDNQQDIEAMEAENKLLREKKAKLIANFNQPSSTLNAIVVVEDIQLRQKNLNQFRCESKQNSVERLKDRIRATCLETSELREKLEDVGNFMVAPYHEVLSKVLELEDQTAENRSAIEDLTKQLSELGQVEQNNVEEAEDIRFIERLRTLAKEQRQLIEKLKGNKV